MGVGQIYLVQKGENCEEITIFVKWLLRTVCKSLYFSRIGMKRIHILGVLGVITMISVLSSCGGQRKSNPFGATGAPSSLVVVLPDSIYNEEVKDSVRAAFARPVFVLPQSEPMQDVMFTPESKFTSMFSAMRNILMVTVDPATYTRPSVNVVRDHFATGQVILHARAESVASLYTLLRVRGAQLSKFLYKEEIKRWGDVLEGTYSSDFARMVEDSIGGVTINAPVEMDFIETGKDFVWTSNMDQRKRMDVVVYTFPYRDKNTFTVDYLVHKRDSVMAANIKGQYEGSYMTTEKGVRPSFDGSEYKGAYTAEVRGLWAMEGDMMGGPFVMRAVVDNQGKRVVVAEAFVYAPGEKKRNLLLYPEASLWTMRPAGSDFETHTHETAKDSVPQGNK